MKQDLTRIVIVLDRSGSMTSVRESAIAGFNEFIQQQRQSGGEIDVLLVQFDDEYEVVFDLPITEVPLLDQETFIPRGSTALYDAQGRTISMLTRQLASLPEEKLPDKIVIVTLTDGQENASRLYELKQIAQMVQKQRERQGWEFIFLGANQDAVATGASMNIPARSSLTYTATPVAVTSAMKSASKQVTLFRQGTTPGFSQSDRQNAMLGRKIASAW